MGMKRTGATTNQKVATFDVKGPQSSSFQRMSAMVMWTALGRMMSFPVILLGSSVLKHALRIKIKCIHFKCPGYYCIPYSIVCNGKWECPWGTDEEQCQRNTCPGLFKCQKSVVCVTILSLCDGIEDCPLREDELFCHPSIPKCPMYCNCLLYLIDCNALPNTRAFIEVEEILPYVSVFVSRSHIYQLHRFLKHFNHSVLVSLTHNQIKGMCDSGEETMKLNYTFWLDISNNLIKSVNSKCFRTMFNLKYLNISFNRITILHSFGFSDAQMLRNLDISANKLKFLNKFSFSGLYNLGYINFSRNPIVEVSLKTLENSLISHIQTESYKVCCVKSSEDTTCNMKPAWPNSCQQLLSDIITRVCMGIVSVVGLLLNIFACIYNNTKLISLARVRTTTGRNYKVIITGIAVGDALCCLSLLIIVLADLLYGSEYLAKEYQWRNNGFCYAAAALSIISNLISTSILNIMAASRLSVTKYPFSSRFLKKGFVLSQVNIIILLSTSIGFALVLSYRFVSEHRLPTGLCLLVGNIDTSTIPKLVTFITLSTQSISIISIPIIYFIIYHTIKTQHISMKGSSHRKSKRNLIGPLLASLTNLLSWIPSSVILTMTLLWSQYPYKLLIYMTAIAIPLNAIVNPCVFVHMKLLQQCLYRMSGLDYSSMSESEIMKLRQRGFSVTSSSSLSYSHF